VVLRLTVQLCGAVPLLWRGEKEFRGKKEERASSLPLERSSRYSLSSSSFIGGEGNSGRGELKSSSLLPRGKGSGWKRRMGGWGEKREFLGRRALPRMSKSYQDLARYSGRWQDKKGSEGFKGKDREDPEDEERRL